MQERFGSTLLKGEHGRNSLRLPAIDYVYTLGILGSIGRQLPEVLPVTVSPNDLEER